MAGEEVVGGIVGYLRLDADQFHREITRAIAETKVLKGMDARVHVEATGAGKAERDIAKVAAASKLASGNVERLGQSFSGGGGGGLFSAPVIIGGITAGLALLGPVLAASTAAVAGFAGAVGTGVLAYQGFKHEVEAGTPLGKAIEGQIDGIKAAFQSLATTAAQAMSGDVLATLGEVRDFLPTINDQVETLAGHLGRAFRVGTGGLLTGLQNMMPLLEDGGKYAEILAQKFADFTASQDFKDFIAYARRELPDLTEALASLGGGLKDLVVSLAPAGDGLISTINLMGKLATGVSWVIDGIGKLNELTKLPLLNGGQNQGNSLLDNLMGDTKDATAAVEDHTSKLQTLVAVQSPLASGLGITDSALQAASQKHRDTASAAKEATLQMQLEGNAAGLLKQSLDVLNGKTLNLASAETNSASATLGVTEALKAHTTETKKGVKVNKDFGWTLDLNSKNGVAARQAIEQKARADQQAAEAVANATGSTEKGTQSLKDNKAALENTLKKQGLLTDKVQAYIDKVYQVPKSVPPTVLEVETATALEQIKAFQKAIDTLHGKTVTAGVRYAYTGTLPNGGKSLHGGLTFADGGEVRSKIPGYAGGTIIGPGSGKSDSILAGIAGTGELIRVSNGEFISTEASQRRNRAALEAGNKGAALGVVGQSAPAIGIDEDRLAAVVGAAVYEGARKGLGERQNSMSGLGRARAYNANVGAS